MINEDIQHKPLQLVGLLGQQLQDLRQNNFDSCPEEQISCGKFSNSRSDEVSCFVAQKINNCATNILDGDIKSHGDQKSSPTRRRLRKRRHTMGETEAAATDSSSNSAAKIMISKNNIDHTVEDVIHRIGEFINGEECSLEELISP